MKQIVSAPLFFLLILCFEIFFVKNVQAYSFKNYRYNIKTDTSEVKKGKKLFGAKNKENEDSLRNRIENDTLKKIKVDTTDLKNPLGLDSIYPQYFLSKLDPIQKLTLWQAEKKYNTEAFIGAIKNYETVLKNADTIEILNRKLANSYRMTNNFEKAEFWYEKLVCEGANTPEDIYYYAEALKKNTKYDESKKWLEKYIAIQKNDPRAQTEMNSFNLMGELMKDSTRFEVSRLKINSEFTDFGPAFYYNKIIFSSTRNNSLLKPKYEWDNEPFLDLYVAEKDSTGELYNALVFGKGLNSKFHEGPVVYGEENNMLYFTRNNYTARSRENRVNRLKIYSAQKEGETWINQEVLPFNSDGYSCGHPALADQGEALYFVSDMPEGYGGTDIYVTRLLNGEWTAPQNLGETINTKGNEMFPYIHKDGTLYFSSNGHEGIGGLDIFYSKFKDGNFSVPKNFGYPLNSSKDDFSFILEANNVTGYFSSNRGVRGRDNLYKVHIEPEPEVIKLAGVAMRKNTGEMLEEVNVSIKNIATGKITNTVTKRNGEFSTILSPGMDYEIVCEKLDYRTVTDTITTRNIKGTTVIAKELLEMYPYTVEGVIVFRETGQPIAGINVTLRDSSETGLAKLVTDATGKFYFPLDGNSKYTIKLNKNDLLSRTRFITTKDTRPGTVKIKEVVEMDQIKIGTLIEVEILFNTGKWDIRPDAQKTLDEEVIQFMLDNMGIKFELGAHTDSRGTKQGNENLSQKRAESSVDYIVSKGIARERITAKGYGESELKNKCADGISCSEEEHQQNRRVEIKVVEF